MGTAPKFERWRLAEIFRCSPDSHEDVWGTRLAQTGSAGAGTESFGCR